MMKTAITLLLGMSLSAASQAALIDLKADLKAPNQNGSNPDVIVDPQGLVASTATGAFSGTLDTDNNTIINISMTVNGLFIPELRNFGPNATPFHIHLPNAGTGTFGFNVIDVPFQGGTFTPTATGFTYDVASISILEADQGAINGLGLHPGDGVIVDRLLSGDAFIAIHSTNNLFFNTVHPPQFPDGFPFVELRGEINAVPVPAALPLLVSGLGVLGYISRRKKTA